jgi:hypothetical protein
MATRRRGGGKRSARPGHAGQTHRLPLHLHMSRPNHGPASGCPQTFSTTRENAEMDVNGLPSEKGMDCLRRLESTIFGDRNGLPLETGIDCLRRWERTSFERTSSGHCGDRVLWLSRPRSTATDIGGRGLGRAGAPQDTGGGGAAAEIPGAHILAKPPRRPVLRRGPGEGRSSDCAWRCSAASGR